MQDKKVPDLWQIPLTSIPEKEKGNNTSQTMARRPTHETLKGIMDETAHKLTSARSVNQVLPDMAWVRRILLIHTISPKTLSKIEFRLQVKDTFESKYDPELTKKIVNHLNRHLDVDENLVEWLGTSYVDEGAHAQLYLPPSVMDQIMAGENFIGMESLDNEIVNAMYAIQGDIKEQDEGKLARFGLEEITDNPNTMRRMEIRNIENRVAKANRDPLAKLAGIESFNDAIPLNRIPKLTKELRDVRNPIVYRIPMDVILPVHYPNDPSRHMGYYIALDELGEIVSYTKEDNYMESMSERIANALKDTKDPMFGAISGLTEDTTHKMTAESIMAFWQEEMQGILDDALDKAQTRNYVEVPEGEDFYRMLFTRFMRQKKTRLLYVPEEYVDYMAFKHNELGIGVGLKEEYGLLSAMRANLLMASVRNGIENSINHTDLEIQLDQDDKKGFETVQDYVDIYKRIHTGAIRWDTTNPTDIAESQQRGAIHVNVEGNEHFPSTKATVNDRQRSMATLDTELWDMLRSMVYTGWEVPAEVVDSALQGNFATGTVNSNLLLAQAGMERQTKYRKLLTRRFKKYTLLSSELYGIIEEDAKKHNYDVEDLLDSLDVVMPQADISNIQQHADEYRTMSDFVDELVKIYVGEDTIRDLFKGEYLDTAVRAVQEHVAAWTKREWCRRNNIFPEMDVYLDETATKSMTDDMVKHNDVVLGIVEKILSEVMNKEFHADEKLREDEEKRQAEADAAAEADDFEGGDDLDTVGDAGDDLGTGGGDTGGGDDIDIDDTTEGATDETGGDDLDDVTAGGDDDDVGGEAAGDDDDLEDLDTGGDGLPDEIDTDDDNDGVPDDTDDDDDNDGTKDDDDDDDLEDLDGDAETDIVE